MVYVLLDQPSRHSTFKNAPEHTYTHTLALYIWLCVNVSLIHASLALWLSVWFSLFLCVYLDYKSLLCCSLTHMATNNERKILTTNTQKSDIYSRTIAHLRFSTVFVCVSVNRIRFTYGSCSHRSVNMLLLLPHGIQNLSIVSLCLSTSTLFWRQHPMKLQSNSELTASICC